ncbi:MAG: hypothetical protein ACQCXQ_03250 [Verrucomicrobiales bacterium]|nr:hypothetical protein [Verrucomicrobiota bacterium JB025]
MQYFISRWLTAAMTCLLTGIAQAERPVQLLYYQSPPDAPSKAFVYAGGAMVAEADLPRANFSKTVNIPDGELRLRFLPEPLAEGAKIPKGTPTVRIPESWSKVLLLVFENEENAVMPIRVRALDASDNVFGPGSIFMMNFSQIRVGGMVGDKRLDLRPRSSSIIKKPLKKNGYYPTELYSLTKKGAKPQRFVKQMWEYNDKTRQVFFVLPKPAPLHATYYCAPVRGL